MSKIDKDTLKKMVELDLQQLAAKYYEEHGVDIAICAHMILSKEDGAFLCGYSHDKAVSFVFNLCYMALSNLELLCEAGIPPEIITDVLDGYASSGPGQHSLLQKVFRA